jgi:hypothetical protein
VSNVTKILLHIKKYIFFQKGKKYNGGGGGGA